MNPLPRLSVYVIPHHIDLESLRDICRAAEESGVLHGAYFADHLFPLWAGSGTHMYECWTLLAIAAGETSTIEIGSLVSPVHFRPPAVLARTVATIQELAEGRLSLGIGAGWSAEELACVEDGLSTRKALERFGARASTLVEEVGAACDRSGVPHPPIVVGGNSARWVLPVAAQLADEWSGGEPVDSFRMVSRRLDEVCAERVVSRSVLLLGMPTPEKATDLLDAGATHIVVGVTDIHGVEAVASLCERLL